MESPKDSHCKVGKRILRYVAGTLNYGLWYTTFKDYSLEGYTNNDFVGTLVIGKTHLVMLFIWVPI
jgi:hypothetical protein